MDKQIQDGIIHLVVFRYDGKVEDHGWHKNLFVSEGGTYLAQLQSTTTTSVMNHMVIGTVSTAASLTDVVDSMGEVARNTMATRTNASNLLTEVCTFAGDTDALTSVQIVEVGITNHPNSGPNGELRSRSVFSQVVLADSDFLQISYETTCGSF